MSFHVLPPSVVRKNVPPVDAMASDELPFVNADLGLNATPLKPAVSPCRADDAATPLARFQVMPASVERYRPTWSPNRMWFGFCGSICPCRSYVRIALLLESNVKPDLSSVKVLPQSVNPKSA